TSTLVVKPEFGVFNEGGYTWTARAKNGYNFGPTGGTVVKTLSCAVNHSEPWECDAGIVMYMRRVDAPAFRWVESPP
ncbi:hypothetical protein PMAYCL1PPCAC_24967, partial [Pristionchus mayeri]